MVWNYIAFPSWFEVWSFCGVFLISRFFPACEFIEWSFIVDGRLIPCDGRVPQLITGIQEDLIIVLVAGDCIWDEALSFGA